jgi:pimeloyl-ACP methyl ester carboxylesterase
MLFIVSFHNLLILLCKLRLGRLTTELLVEVSVFKGIRFSSLSRRPQPVVTTYSRELDYTADIAKCDKPLLVIHCEDDQIVPIGPTGRRVPSVVPHAILKVYKGGAHGIAIIDPGRVNTDFLAFIKGEMKK